MKKTVVMAFLAATIGLCASFALGVVACFVEPFPFEAGMGEPYLQIRVDNLIRVHVVDLML